MMFHAYFYHKTVLRNTTYLDSVYFTFVTVTTIGFGDIVPDVEYMERLGIPMKNFLFSLYPFLFYTNFSLLASVIGSLTSAETDRGDVKVRDKNTT